jgi:hypothetical protein
MMYTSAPHADQNTVIVIKNKARQLQIAGRFYKSAFF